MQLSYGNVRLHPLLLWELRPANSLTGATIPTPSIPLVFESFTSTVLYTL